MLDNHISVEVNLWYLVWDNHVSVEVNLILYFVEMITREALFAWYIKWRVFKVVMCSCTVRELCMLSNTPMKKVASVYLANFSC